jgi:hypothetical protein
LTTLSIFATWGLHVHVDRRDAANEIRAHTEKGYDERAVTETVEGGEPGD